MIYVPDNDKKPSGAPITVPFLKRHKYIIMALTYILIIFMTATYHYKRNATRADVPFTSTGPDAMMVGAFWPFYWTYRLCDAIIDPDPVPLTEDDKRRLKFLKDFGYE